MSAITLIAAMDEDGLIGVEGRLHWHLPRDLEHFRSATTGKPVVMGRVTWESIGRPLPRRLNIVLTRDPHFAPQGCVVTRSVEEALEAAGEAAEVMVIGGASVYEQFLPIATRLCLTVVHHRFRGDASFPAFERGEWTVVKQRTVPADDSNPYACTFQTLEKIFSEH